MTRTRISELRREAERARARLERMRPEDYRRAQDYRRARTVHLVTLRRVEKRLAEAEANRAERSPHSARQEAAPRATRLPR